VLAVMDVESIETVSDEQMAHDDREGLRHPRHRAPRRRRPSTPGPHGLLRADPGAALLLLPDDFPDTFRTAVEIRNEIAERGWKRVVAFQTRNPMHLAHEELCHMAMERLGVRRPGHPHAARQAQARRYPGPGARRRHPQDGRAVLPAEQRHGHRLRLRHALRRPARGRAARLLPPEHGRTHFIVGRDHAGVGDYYGAFDAQTIFDEQVPEARSRSRSSRPTTPPTRRS
jgi:sulfate adenylyltransferase